MLNSGLSNVDLNILGLPRSYTRSAEATGQEVTQRSKISCVSDRGLDGFGKQLPADVAGAPKYDLPF